MAQRPTLTVSAAVDAFDVERRTLQRLLASGQLHGASKDKRGRWTIPIETLHAAGFSARQTWQFDATNSATERETDATRTRKNPSNQGKTSTTVVATERETDATDLRLHIAQLEAELRAERQLREAAERNAEDLRTAMRMIEGGKSDVPTARSAETPTRRRLWWGPQR